MCITLLHVTSVAAIPVLRIFSTILVAYFNLTYFQSTDPQQVAICIRSGIKTRIAYLKNENQNSFTYDILMDNDVMASLMSHVSFLQSAHCCHLALCLKEQPEERLNFESMAYVP